MLNREKSIKMSEECTYFHLRKVSRLVYNYYDKIMSDLEVSPAQFSLLNAIYLAKKKLTISEFAKVIAMDRTTLTRNLKLLEKNGLVKTGKSKEDSRKKIFFLTKKGETILSKDSSVWEEAQSSFLDLVGKDNWSNLMEILNKFESFQENLSI